MRGQCFTTTTTLMRQIKDLYREARIHLALESNPPKTFAEIAKLEGISWQRVQQIAKRLKVDAKERRAKTVERIVEAAFAPGITGYQDLQREHGYVYRTAHTALEEARMLKAAERLWATRRAADDKSKLQAKREEMAASMRRLSKRLNRTPGSRDLNAKNSGTPSAAMYVHYFGSLRLAQAAAGLTPRGLGYKGHVKRRPNDGSSGRASP